MNYIKLEDPGASVAMLVDEIKRGKSNFGEDYVFVGHVEPNVVASVSVPEKAAERQFEKILKIDDATDTVGRFIVISRSTEPGPNKKLYWNIEWANEDTFNRDEVSQPVKSAPAPSRRVQPPPSESQQRPRASEPVTEEELSSADKKKRARMVLLTKVFRAMWEDELDWQTALMAKRLEAGLPVVDVNGASVNAAVASRFIEFNRGNLL